MVDDKIRALIHGRAAESAALRRRRGGRPALDARGRRAAGRRRHHVARRSDARHARVDARRASPVARAARLTPCPPTVRSARRRRQGRPPACSRPTTRGRALAAARAGAGAARRHAGGRPAPARPAGFSLGAPGLQRHRLAVWTRQLAGLVGSGLPLERALTALADEAEDPRQRELVAHLRSEVNAGSPVRPRAGAARRASSTTSTAASSPPASRAARSASCSSASPTTSRSARS